MPAMLSTVGNRGRRGPAGTSLALGHLLSDQQIKLARLSALRESCSAHHSIRNPARTARRIAYSWQSQIPNPKSQVPSPKSQVPSPKSQASNQFLDQLNLPRVIRRVARDPDHQVEPLGLRERRDASTARDLTDCPAEPLVRRVDQ
jgi:hypothetical protein